MVILLFLSAIVALVMLVHVLAQGARDERWRPLRALTLGTGAFRHTTIHVQGSLLSRRWWAFRL